jgi:hypothetical protein
VTETHYYSVFPNPRTGQLMLLISDVAKKETDAGLYDDFAADHPDCHAAGEETLERPIHPWLSLSFQISPAVAAGIKTKKDEEKMLALLKLLLLKNYDFVVAHDIPTDKTVGFCIEDQSTGRTYLIHVIPEDQVVDVDYAPAGFAEEMRASPHFHHV